MKMWGRGRWKIRLLPLIQDIFNQIPKGTTGKAVLPMDTGYKPQMQTMEVIFNFHVATLKR